MSKLSEFQKEKRFERNRSIINRVVRGHLAKNKTGIVHGTRATNVQLPKDLNRRTIDWDIFSKTPLVDALKLENKLDKKFRGDFFEVRRGKGSPGIRVWKIRSNINGEGFVDFATPNREIETIHKRGVRFATLEDQARRARRNIKKPELKFRRKKDLDLLTRIRIAKSGRRVK